VPATSATSSKAIFSLFFLLQPLTVLIRQTRQAVRAINQFIFLRCLWFYVTDLNFDTLGTKMIYSRHQSDAHSNQDLFVYNVFTKRLLTTVQKHWKRHYNNTYKYFTYNHFTYNIDKCNITYMFFYLLL
jgi:hypothetical protein